MGNNLRCCLSCLLPCGSLDMIRIVHLNGHVEEIAGPITAGEILKENPSHVLTKACSQAAPRKILVLAPATELQRGSIYFLVPSSRRKPSSKKMTARDDSSKTEAKTAVAGGKRHRRRRQESRDGKQNWLPRLEIINED